MNAITVKDLAEHIGRRCFGILKSYVIVEKIAVDFYRQTVYNA